MINLQGLVLLFTSTGSVQPDRCLSVFLQHRWKVTEADCSKGELKQENENVTLLRKTKRNKRNESTYRTSEGIFFLQNVRFKLSSSSSDVWKQIKLRSVSFTDANSDHEVPTQALSETSRTLGCGFQSWILQNIIINIISQHFFEYVSKFYTLGQVSHAWNCWDKNM